MDREQRGFIPKPKLAQSNFHHRALGSSHRHTPDTLENLHRPAHEFLSDDELWAQIGEEVAQVRETLKDFRNAQDPDEKQRLEKLLVAIRDKFLFPNLEYLAAIGRLPEEVSVSRLKEELISL